MVAYTCELKQDFTSCLIIKPPYFLSKSICKILRLIHCLKLRGVMLKLAYLLIFVETIFLLSYPHAQFDNLDNNQQQVFIFGNLRAIAYSPTSDLMVTNNAFGIVFWDTRNYNPIAFLGEESAELLAYNGWLVSRAYSMVFSPDGHLLAASAMTEGGIIIQLWDVSEKELLETIRGFEGPRLNISYGAINSFAFTADGLTLAIISGEKLKFWDITNKQFKNDLKLPRWKIPGIAFSPDGSLLAVLNEEGTIKLFHAQTLELKSTLKVGRDGIAKSLAFSPDSRFLAVGIEDTWEDTQFTGNIFIQLWDVNEYELKTTFVAQQNYSSFGFPVVFSPTESILASGGFNLNLWEIPTFKPKANLLSNVSSGTNSAQYNPNDLLAFSYDGRHLASASYSGLTINIWDVQKQKRHNQLWEYYNLSTVALFSPRRPMNFNSTGSILALNDPAVGIELWNLENRKVKNVLLELPSKVLTYLAFDSDDTLISIDRNSTINWWDVDNLQLKATVQANVERKADIIALNHNNSLLAICNWHGKVIRLFNAKNGEFIVDLNTNSVTDLRFHPKGNILISESSENPSQLWNFEGTSRLWDIESGEVKTTLEGHSFLDLSSDGSTLALLDKMGTIKLWDFESEETILMLPSSSKRTCCATFNSDGSILASSGEGKYIKLWDVASGRLETTLEGSLTGNNLLKFSPDGRYLVSSSPNDTFRFWNVEEWTNGEP